jgi:hypothetical protein
VRRCIALCQSAHLIFVQVCSNTVQASRTASDRIGMKVWGLR